jgi:hypothetical protein
MIPSTPALNPDDQDQVTALEMQGLQLLKIIDGLCEELGTVLHELHRLTGNEIIARQAKDIDAITRPPGPAQ